MGRFIGEKGSSVFHLYRQVIIAMLIPILERPMPKPVFSLSLSLCVSLSSVSTIDDRNVLISNFEKNGCYF